MITSLDTGVKIVRNVGRFTIGDGSISGVADLVNAQRTKVSPNAIYLIDEFFENSKDILNPLGIVAGDAKHFIKTTKEPTTQGIDELVSALQLSGHKQPATIVGVGGGITLDTAKAVSNLYCVSEEVGFAHNTHEFLLGNLTVVISVGLLNHLCDLLVSHVLA